MVLTPSVPNLNVTLDICVWTSGEGLGHASFLSENVMS